MKDEEVFSFFIYCMICFTRENILKITIFDKSHNQLGIHPHESPTIYRLLVGLFVCSFLLFCFVCLLDLFCYFLFCFIGFFGFFLRATKDNK